MFVHKLTATELATRDFQNWEVPSETVLRQAFDLFDTNGDGVVDFDEIQKSMFKYFGIRLTKEETRSMLILYDTDESGALCYEEFKVMIQNLESLDPASVGRFWMKQLGKLRHCCLFLQEVISNNNDSFTLQAGSPPLNILPKKLV